MRYRCHVLAPQLKCVYHCVSFRADSFFFATKGSGRHEAVGRGTAGKPPRPRPGCPSRRPPPPRPEEQLCAVAPAAGSPHAGPAELIHARSPISLCVRRHTLHGKTRLSSARFCNRLKALCVGPAVEDRSHTPPSTMPRGAIASVIDGAT